MRFIRIFFDICRTGDRFSVAFLSCLPLGQITWNLTGLSPKWDWSPKSAVPPAIARPKPAEKRFQSIFKWKMLSI